MTDTSYAIRRDDFRHIVAALERSLVVIRGTQSQVTYSYRDEQLRLERRLLYTLYLLGERRRVIYTNGIRIMDVTYVTEDAFIDITRPVLYAGRELSEYQWKESDLGYEEDEAAKQ